MQALILTLHVIVCIVLIVVVLLQSGKEGMGVIFGGGSSSLFGGSGAGGLLAKVTALMAAIFLITSLSYTYMTRGERAREMSIMDQAVERQLEQPAPEQGIQVEQQGQPAAGDAVPGLQSESAPAPAADAPSGAAGTEGQTGEQSGQQTGAQQ